MREPTIFPAIALTGGTIGALDSYSLSDLQDEDGAMVMCTDYTYNYTFDADNSEVESSPDIIKPDDAGVDDGRWVLTKYYIANDSDKLNGKIDSDFAAAVHGAEHDPDGDDPILDSTTTDRGWMSSDSHQRLWTPMSFRNLIINGNMTVWQRGIAASSGAGYTADQWRATGASNIPSVQRSSVSPLTFDSRYQYTLRANTTEYTDAGEYQIISQRIENVRTCAGKRVTLSFMTYCTTSSHIAVQLRQEFGTGGSPSTTVSVTTISGLSPKVAVGTTWTKHVLYFDLPTIAGSTIGTNDDSYLTVMFWLSGGASFIDITDGMGPQTIQVYLKDVQLEEGYIEDPVFEDRPVSIEETLCQRYYWMKGGLQLHFGAYADNCRFSCSLGPSVPMRAVPTASSSFSNISATSCDSFSWSVPAGADKNTGGLLYALSTAEALNCYFTFGSGDYIALSAEL